MKFNAIRIWGIKNLNLFKGIKGGVLRHLSYKSQSNRSSVGSLWKAQTKNAKILISLKNIH